jgi:hypothetical protein
MKQTKSWGHRIDPLERAQVSPMAAALGLDGSCLSVAWSDHCGRRIHRRAVCGQPATHMLTYEYVTGRAGRTTYARRSLCEPHAREAAARYGIRFPSEPEPNG